jgi:hypothetical protein
VRRLIPLLALAACGGPLDETLVDELRTIAAPVDPPELVPGEPFTAAPLVVDPQGRAVEVLIWTCIIAGPPGQPCLEFAGGAAPTVAVVAAGQAAALFAPSAPAALIPDEGAFIADLRMLACAPGLCPIFDEVRGGVDASDEDLVRRLSDPRELLRGLPIEGVSYARRDLRLVRSAEGARRENPTLGATGPASVERGGTAELVAAVELPDDLAATVYPFASAGGFDALSASVVDGAATLRWIAPVEGGPAPVQVWLVVADERGGEAVWSGSIQVR